MRQSARSRRLRVSRPQATAASLRQQRLNCYLSSHLRYSAIRSPVCEQACGFDRTPVPHINTDPRVIVDSANRCVQVWPELLTCWVLPTTNCRLEAMRVKRGRHSRTAPHPNDIPWAVGLHAVRCSVSLRKRGLSNCKYRSIYQYIKVIKMHYCLSQHSETGCIRDASGAGETHAA